MSYLLAKTTSDELLLMIAAEDGETRPGPWEENPDLPDHMQHARRRIPPRNGPGFVWLNMTDNLRVLEPRLIYQNPRQGFVVHLTWAGWDRVDELLAQGLRLPTEEERNEYARRARVVVEGGEHGDLIPLDVPNPRGLEPSAPARAARTSWWRRLFGMDRG